MPEEGCKEISANAIMSLDDLEKIPIILWFHTEGTSNLGTKSLHIHMYTLDVHIDVNENISEQQTNKGVYAKKTVEICTNADPNMFPIRFFLSNKVGQVGKNSSVVKRKTEKMSRNCSSLMTISFSMEGERVEDDDEDGDEDEEDVDVVG